MKSFKKVGEALLVIIALLFSFYYTEKAIVILESNDPIMKEIKENKVNSEEKAIIDNRYMKDYTQSETSKLVGMSQVQVSRKEQKVLQKLKQKMSA